MARFAKVIIESPLPQLDRVFDYSIPESLSADIRIGQRVSVPFGKTTRLIEAFVVDLVDEVEFVGEVHAIEAIVSKSPVLPSQHYDYLRAVADRQAVAIGDVLKQAVPDRSARVDNAWGSEETWEFLAASGRRISHRVSPGFEQRQYGEITLNTAAWVHESVELALDAIAAESSAVICVPDYRDVLLVKRAFEALGISKIVIEYKSNDTKVQRYEAYLGLLTESPVIVLGTRSVMYAPVSKLASIIVFDDANRSHCEISSPYMTSRDLAILRNQIHKTEIHLLNHAPSTNLLRLETLGFFEVLGSATKPRIAYSSATARLDDLAYATIRNGLAHGPVLVQVSNLGVAKSLYCASCSSRTLCRHCSLGGLWVNESGQLSCRVCAALNLDFKCSSCGSSKTRMGRAGATRTTTEIGRSFPGVKVTEATGNNIEVFIEDEPRIVVATPEAAPFAPLGYSAIVIIDADVALSRDTLTAREDAIRQWANTAALGSREAQIALVGVPPDIGTKFATWQLDAILSEELNERISHGLPPAVRIVTVSGSADIVGLATDEFLRIEGVALIGRMATEYGSTAILKFPYRQGQSVATCAKALSLKTSTKARTARSGRNARALTVKMDDLQVL